MNYRKDGSTFINEWHIESVVIEENQTRYFLAIQHDVTERERLYQQLESKHQAMHELLQQIEWEKQKVREDIALRIEEELLPSIQKLKRQGSQLDNQQLTILENNLRELNAGSGRCLSTNGFSLSPKEVKVAQMIRQGLSTKAIAVAFHTSERTIETHRNRIRKKLGIDKSQVNLSTYLQSL